MKWVFAIFFMIHLNTMPAYSQRSLSTKINLSYFSAQPYSTQKILLSPSVLLQTGIEKIPQLKEKSTADYVTFILLWITTLLTIFTPLTLIYLWILYSTIYVKKYRRIFSIKKWIFGKSNLTHDDLNDVIRLSYRKVYSLMVGFGIAIVAYAIASIRFMLLNFDEMETAMSEYFRFPFLVLDEFGLINSSKEIEMKFEDFWNHMLLIVVISGMFFLVGYLLGSLVVDLRFKLLNKQVQKSSKKIRIKKEMFSLKTKEDHTLHA